MFVTKWQISFSQHLLHIHPVLFAQRYDGVRWGGFAEFREVVLSLQQERKEMDLLVDLIYQCIKVSMGAKLYVSRPLVLFNNKTWLSSLRYHIPLPKKVMSFVSMYSNVDVLYPRSPPIK